MKAGFHAGHVQPVTAVQHDVFAEWHLDARSRHGRSETAVFFDQALLAQRSAFGALGEHDDFARVDRVVQHYRIEDLGAEPVAQLLVDIKAGEHGDDVALFQLLVGTDFDELLPSLDPEGHDRQPQFVPGLGEGIAALGDLVGADHAQRARTG